MSMNTQGLSEVLFPKSRRAILSLLYGQSHSSFYTNEIVRAVNTGIGSVQRELEKLTTAGILRVKKIGNQKHYQANPECPVYSELHAIVRKTFGVAGEIRKALELSNSKIDMAFIFGSIAKGEETANSDVDLLIISDEAEFTDVMNELAGAEKIIGRTINPVIYKWNQIHDRLKSKNPFLKRVLKQDKIWIKGSQDDFEGTGQSRQDK